MPATNSLFRQLPTQEWDRLQLILKEFDTEWQRGQRPALTEYLAREPVARLALLLELIHVELEFRLKADEPVRMESYLDSYPELTAHPNAVADLIAEEYRLRRTREADLSPQTYFQRFPQFREQLALRLPTLPTTEAETFDDRQRTEPQARASAREIASPAWTCRLSPGTRSWASWAAAAWASSTRPGRSA